MDTCACAKLNHSSKMENRKSHESREGWASYFPYTSFILTTFPKEIKLRNLFFSTNFKGCTVNTVVE